MFINLTNIIDELLPFILFSVIVIIFMMYIFDSYDVFAYHQCYPLTNSSTSHFDYINQTFTLNMTHFGYCLSS